MIALDKRKYLDYIITLVTYLMLNLRTRNRFGTKSRDQIDGVSNQFHLPRSNSSGSLNFIPYQHDEKWKELII